MKKLFPLIILLLLGTWAGTTWLISRQVEQNFDRALDQLNQKLKKDLPFFEAQAESFSKGLLRSKATSKITLRGDNGDDVLYLRHDIYQGPLMFTPMGVKLGSTYIVTTLDLDKLAGERREAIEKATDGKTPVTIGMLTGTNRNFDLDIDVSPLEISDEAKDVTIRFGGMKGAIKSDFDGSYLKGELRSGRLTIDSSGNDQLRFEMAPTTVAFDIDQMYHGTALSGTSSLTSPELALTGPEGIDIRSRNIQLTSDTKQNDGDTTDVTVSLETKPITVDLPPKRIQLDEAAIAFDTRIEGMKTKQLKKLVDAGAKLQSLDPEAVENAETVLDEELLNYLVSIVELLQPGLGTTTHFDFNTPKGKFDTRLALGYVGTRPAIEQATLRALLSAIDGKLDIVVDEALLTQLSLEQLAQMPVAMGFAVSENGKITSQITIRNGVIRINGEQTPFLDMLGPILDEPSPLRQLSADAQKPV